MNDDISGFQRSCFRDRIFEFSEIREGANGGDFDRLSKLAGVWSEFASFERQQGNNDQARSHSQTAIKVWERVLMGDPDNVEYCRKCATDHHNLGTLFLENNEFNQAEVSLQRAVELLEKVTTDKPDDQTVCHELSQTISDLGIVAVLTNRRELAAERFDRAKAICERLVKENPTNQNFQDAYKKSQLLVRQLEGQGPRSRTPQSCALLLILIGVVVTLMCAVATNVLASID